MAGRWRYKLYCNLPRRSRAIFFTFFSGTAACDFLTVLGLPLFSLLLVLYYKFLSSVTISTFPNIHLLSHAGRLSSQQRY